MTSLQFSLVELKELIPYAILTGGAIFILLFSLLLPKTGNSIGLKICTVLIAVSASFSLFYYVEPTRPFGGLLSHDSLGFGFAQVILLFLALAVPMFSMEATAVCERSGTVFGLFLLSACGGILAVYANDLLLFFLGLELLSLPLYILTGVGISSKKGSEAAFKYFMLGATSSALFIYGTALLFGALGTTNLSKLAMMYSNGAFTSPGMVVLGSTLVLSGVIFKLGLVPFQMWVPDVYEGAPSYVVAWMSGTTKAAMIPLALRLLGQVFTPALMDWSSVLSCIALASMLWGAFAALHQTNIKRMLAYSSIAHAGYMTIALACAHEGAQKEALAALVYYVLTYGISSLICFAVLSLDEREGRVSLDDLRGLAKRKPGLAFIFTLALLSLAGIPPLGGFFGKFNIFALGIQKNYVGLVVVGVIASLVSLGYYLRIIVSMYMEESLVLSKLDLRFGMRSVLVLSTFLIVILGVLPNWAVQFFATPFTFLSLK